MIYILGSLNMDLSISSNRFPNDGETLEGQSFHTCPGGKGLNQAIAAAKLGAKVKMLGAIGNDSFGKEMKEALVANNVDVSDIKTLQNINSGIAVIIVSNGENRIVLDLAANLHIENSDIDRFLSQATSDDIFLTQLENNIDAITYALKVAKSKNMMTIVDPAPMNNAIISSLQNIDVLLPNSEELRELLKHESFDKNYKNHLIVTLGKDGYKYSFNGGVISNKPIQVKAIDTTGAGDTFSGALVSKLSRSKIITKECLDFACLAASISTTKKGSSISSPTLKEIEEFKLNK